jgi:hypothetical protein
MLLWPARRANPPLQALTLAPLAFLQEPEPGDLPGRRRGDGLKAGQKSPRYRRPPRVQASRVAFDRDGGTPRRKAYSQR